MQINISTRHGQLSAATQDKIREKASKLTRFHERLTAAVRDVFPLSPRSIISYLDLLRPIFKKTAAYGHFGRNDSDFTWEKTDRVDDLRSACKV